MPNVIGYAAKLYRNTGTYGTPSWDLIDSVQDLTLDLSADEADATTRAGGGWKQYLPGLFDATINFSMLWDNTNADFEALRDAWQNRTSIEVLVLDGAQGTAGNEGLRAICMVSAFTRNEARGDALTVDFTLRPMANSSGAPTWHTTS